MNISQFNRKQAPDFKQVTQIHFPKVAVSELDNGIPVYTIAGGSQEVIKIDLVFKAGSAYARHKLIAPFTNQMLNEGTIGQTSKQIADTFDFYGAYFQPTAEKDNAMVNLLCLTKHLPKVLGLLNEIIMESTFPENELTLQIDKRRQNFLVEQEKTSFLAREAFFEQLYGENHPYGQRTKTEHYNQIDRLMLNDFYQNHYHADNCFMVLSGQVTDQELKLINQSLGRISNGKISIPLNIAFRTDISASVLHIDKPDAVQSSIRMGMTTINKLHPDYLGLKVLTTIFGGYFGSRLMKNIREDKGYTYGIHAMQVSMIQSGYMGIAADVKAGHTRQAIDEVRKEIEKIKSHPVEKDEMDLVRNFMMGDMLQMFDGPLATSDTFKGAMEFGYGLIISKR
jgi:zinc protease